MCAQILDCSRVLFIFNCQSAACEREVVEHVDFVKGDPVFDLVLVTGEDRSAVLFKRVDHPAVFPAVELFEKTDRKVEVADRNQRFNTVFRTFVEYLVVKCESFFVGLILESCRKDARPAQGKTEAFKSHLRHERDVFFITMIEVHRPVSRISVSIVTGFYCHFAFRDGHPVFAVG